MNTIQKKFIQTDTSTPSYFTVIGVDKLPTTSLTKETARKINEIQGELIKIGSLVNAWYHVGCKREVPDDVCYVGRARTCKRWCGHRLSGDECYVWVTDQGRAELSEFTLSIIALAGMFKDMQLVTVPSGIQYSPTFSTGGR